MTVKEMLELESFMGTQVLTGESGLTRKVKEISVMEVPDIGDYVHAQGFLLTTLYPVSQNEKEQNHLIALLDQIGCSGIGIKLNRYVQSVPEQMRKTAKELGFPILVLPEQSNFSVMITDYLNKSIQIQNEKLAFRDKLHFKLMEFMRSDPDYDELCKELYHILKKDVVILDGKRSVLACYPAKVSEEDRKLFEENLHSFVQGVPQHKRYGTYSVYPACKGSRVVGYIGVNCGEESRLHSFERIAAETFALGYEIVFQNKEAIARMELHYLNEFVSELLLREMESPRSMEWRARSLGIPTQQKLSILVLSVDSLPEEIPDKNAFLEQIKQAMSPGYAGSLVLANVERCLVAFIERGEETQFLLVVDELKRILKVLGIEQYHMGISQTAQSIAEYSDCYEEAKKALSIAEWSGEKKIMYAEQLGVYRIIYGCRNKEELIAFSNRLLENVIAYDKKNGTDLLKTLAAFIESGGNLKDTAEELYIHYNTARYRYRMLCELTGKRLQHFNELWDLNLALKIYFAFGQKN